MTHLATMSAIYRYCCAWCGSIPPLLITTYVVDDSDDELYEPLMDDNETNAISELLVYLENVCAPAVLQPESRRYVLRFGIICKG